MSESESSVERTFTVATDEVVSDLIQHASDRVLFITPGITEPVAAALIAKLVDSRVTVTVILDSDPEVYRLGFCTPEGLARLKEHFDTNQADLRCQPDTEPLQMQTLLPFFIAILKKPSPSRR